MKQIQISAVHPEPDKHTCSLKRKKKQNFIDLFKLTKILAKTLVFYYSNTTHYSSTGMLICLKHYKQ